MKSYVLKRDTTNETMFEATYAKHYYEGYCAMFENYPASNTRVLLCRRLDRQDKSYRHNLMSLIQQYPEGESRHCGYYVIIKEVSSEEEATNVMLANIAGLMAMKQALEG